MPYDQVIYQMVTGSVFDAYLYYMKNEDGQENITPWHCYHFSLVESSPLFLL